VKFELLLELKFEQKKGTSLVKPVLSRRKSGLRTERLSVPVIYFGYRAGIHSDLAVLSASQRRNYIHMLQSFNVIMVKIFTVNHTGLKYVDIMYLSTRLHETPKGEKISRKEREQYPK
jgi:hypothetical protein